MEPAPLCSIKPPQCGDTWAQHMQANRYIWREQWGDEAKIKEKRKGVGFVFPESNLFQSNYALLPVLNFLLHCCDICMRMG